MDVAVPAWADTPEKVLQSLQPDPDAPTDAELAARVREVSRFQAKAALSQAGLLPSVEQAIAAAGTLAQLAWAEAAVFRRDSPTIAAMAAALSLTDEQVDDLFAAAALIEA